MSKKFKCSYKTAVNWLQNSLIMCNDICTIDTTVYGNMRFGCYNDETNEDVDIYQWFLTDCNEREVVFLEQHFGLLFTYSELLGMYVLCVDHYGTSWGYVTIETDLEAAAE